MILTFHSQICQLNNKLNLISSISGDSSKDKIFTDEEITDENFIKRVAYRGLIMTNSESLKLLDGLYLTNRDQLKASKLSELFKNLKM